MAKKPHEIRRGLIKARVWTRKSKTGERFSVAVSRVYRNGDVWKESSRFGRDDIPLIRLVLDEAYEWIFIQSNGVQ